MNEFNDDGLFDSLSDDDILSLYEDVVNSSSDMLAAGYSDSRGYWVCVCGLLTARCYCTTCSSRQTTTVSKSTAGCK